MESAVLTMWWTFTVLVWEINRSPLSHCLFVCVCVCAFPSNTLLFNLLHLCATLQSTHPAIGRRILAEKYSLAATWKRGNWITRCWYINNTLWPLCHEAMFLQVGPRFVCIAGGPLHILGFTLYRWATVGSKTQLQCANKGKESGY